MNEKLTDSNFLLYCASHYDNVKYASTEDFVEEKYKVKLTEPIFVGDINVAHNLQGTSAVNEIRDKHRFIDYTFFGSNKIPPVIIEGLAPKRIGIEEKDLIFPFYHLYKTDIIQLAETYQLTELYNLTQTCTENHIQRCNMCWQCKERLWAFKQLNINDTGTN